MTVEKQKARALRLVSSVGMHTIRLRTLAAELMEVLGEAQNGPPDGCADGSLSEEEWANLSHVAKSLYKAVMSIDHLPEPLRPEIR
jgi:hypothetical protein